MDVFIHIGYPKTGSTAIQSHVFANQQWLIKKGLYIPKAGYGGGFGHGHLLPTSFKAPVEFGEKQGPTELELLVGELQQAEEDGFRKCLLTWEGFTDKREHELTDFGEALSSHNVIVLAYVREHAQLFQSGILQDLEQLRFGRGKSVFDRAQMFEHMGPKFDFYQLLKIWERTFDPRVQVKTRLYERSRLLEGNVVLDFLQWLGLDADEHFCLQSRSVNPSLDCRSGGLLVAANASGIEAQTLRPLANALVSVIADEGAHSRQFLTEEEHHEIRETFLESSRLLFSEFRPENANAGETEFPLSYSPEKEAASESSFDWLQRVYDAMHEPRIPMWQGNVLTSHNLAKVANTPSRGWRMSEQLGIWSVGYESELIFYIPEVDPAEGPKAINLVIAGHYFGDNNRTRVAAGGREQTEDLTRAEVRIDLDDDMRENGVKVLLKHDSPEFPEEPDGTLEENGVAFKLQFLSYDFIWE